MKQLLCLVFVGVFGFGLVMADDENHEETVRNYLRASDTCVLVALYKTEWIPPSKEVPKGRMVNHGRIVRVFKGAMEVGDQIIYTDLIEESPKWLKSFVREEEADLFFVVVDTTDAKRMEGRTEFKYGSEWVVSFKDELFSALLKKELGFAQ